jgi:hypothetical protein
MASAQKSNQISAAVKTKTRKTRRRPDRRADAPIESSPGAPVKVLEVYGTVTGSGKAVPTKRVESSILDALS